MKERQRVSDGEKSADSDRMEENPPGSRRVRSVSEKLRLREEEFSAAGEEIVLQSQLEARAVLTDWV
jgi:hypothetical protein